VLNLAGSGACFGERAATPYLHRRDTDMSSEFRPPWVTIVSGLPRSGTSMMMQVLAAGGLSVLVDQVRQADADNVKGYFEYEPVKRTREDASWLNGAVGKAVKMVYLLLYDLPSEYQYRVVFMQRHMDEVLASQHAMLTRLGQAGAALSDKQMADAFARQRQTAEQWLANQPNFRTLKIDYHHVLARPADQAAKLDDFLGRGLNCSAMVAAVNPALRRQKV
jgi:hypothetical protein